MAGLGLQLSSGNVGGQNLNVVDQHRSSMSRKALDDVRGFSILGVVVVVVVLLLLLLLLLLFVSNLHLGVS